MVKDIIESAEKIKQYVKGMSYSNFNNDPKTVDAVVRNFEIIGEAANRIPDDIKNKYPDIDWMRIQGLRNRIVHDYFGIDLEIIWSIIQEYLDQLAAEIQSIKG